ncbi:hypothetical protein GSH19_05425 [Lactobacillus sp. S2-2]|uniref:hypothetical protein n=1 Tax=Lactobacillus sp. S2-2 TaxID=2692917 RepID=UPI001F2A5C53|nr:hypothetical protein [Lactobacillus sp. S2-2]MCF6515593.1 hypothetical protein [Lactobacillus sp. S2-2]
MNLNSIKQFSFLVIACFTLLLISNNVSDAKQVNISTQYVSISGKEFLEYLKQDYPNSYKNLSKVEKKGLNNQKSAAKLSKTNSNYKMILSSNINILIPKLSMVATSGTISDSLTECNNLEKSWSNAVNFGTAFTIIYANDIQFNNQNISVSYKSIPKHQNSYVVTSFK